MLEGQDRRGREHGHLLRVVHCFEGGAHGDFRLTVAHISAEQAVHGQCGFHVVLNVSNGSDLVVCFVELEGVFKLALPLRVRGKAVALRGLARGIKLEQLDVVIQQAFISPVAGIDSIQAN